MPDRRQESHVQHAISFVEHENFHRRELDRFALYQIEQASGCSNQDGSATSINHTGLGGLDFTKDGPNRMTGIRLSVGADHPNSVVKLRIYSDANNWSEFTTTVPESVGCETSGPLSARSPFRVVVTTRPSV